MAIHSALELVTSHFSFERGYIIEIDANGKTMSNTFEWCADGILSPTYHQFLKPLGINNITIKDKPVLKLMTYSQ